MVYDHHEKPVVNDLDRFCCNGTIIEKDVVDNATIEKSRADVLTRSVLRHDSQKLASIIQELI